ncbi:MAG: hypothetical protein KKB20_21680 [Proteobacteria bacterium]|nr:hypothetical protein [Pseudomonadota bacterium]
MQRTFVSLILCAALVLGGAATIKAEPDAAMVTDLTGGKAVYRSGAKAGGEVMLMDFLAVGDRIELDEKALLTLNYFTSGNRERVSGPGQLEVTAKGSQAGPGIKLHSAPAAFLPPKADLSDYDTRQTATVAMREARETKIELSKQSALDKRADDYRRCGIESIGLFQTGTRLTKPVLRWRPLEKATLYQFTLFDGQGQKLRSENMTSKTLARPLMNLKRGQRYRWQLVALAGDQTLARCESWFWTLSKDQSLEVVKAEKEINAGGRAASSETRIALAMLYHTHGLFDEEAEMLEKVLAQQPGNENISRYLIKLRPVSH